MSEILNLIFLTLAPFLELRASIPYGVFKTELSLLVIFLTCTITNILLAPLVYLFYDKIIHIFLKIKLIDRLYQKLISRTQKKVHKYVERWGILGLAFFIGIPLPGSGVYTGALAAYLLGFRKRDFLLAAIIGVCIAAVLVTLISLSGNTLFNFFLKKI